MSEKINGITERLIVKADEELKRRIDEAGEPLYKAICDGCGHDISVQSGDRKVRVNYIDAWRGLKELAFELRKVRNQQDKLDEFMSKVEQLSNDVEELRQSIPQ